MLHQGLVESSVFAYETVSNTVTFKVYGYTSVFSAIFAKGDNFRDFLFASLEDNTIPKGVNF